MSKEIARSVEEMRFDAREALGEATRQGGSPQDERPRRAKTTSRAGGEPLDSALVSDPDRAAHARGDHDGTLGGRLDLAAWSQAHEAAGGLVDAAAPPAAGAEAFEPRADASRRQAMDLLAAVSTLISSAETRQDKEWETLADLSQKLDDLELRLGARGDARFDDAFLKSALQGVEAGLAAFMRRRSPAAASVQSADPLKSPHAESAAPASSPSNWSPAPALPSKPLFPLRSDLLARLNAAMPANAAAPIGGGSDFAELARKLDEMCRGVSPSRGQGSEATRGGGPSLWEADAASLSRPLWPAAEGRGATAPKTPDLKTPDLKTPDLETPDLDASAAMGTGRDAGGMDRFDGIAREARGSVEETDRSSIIDASPRGFESPGQPGGDPAAFAGAPEQIPEFLDPTAAAAARPLPIDKLERQVALLTEGLDAPGQDNALDDGGGLDHEFASQAIEARPDALAGPAADASDEASARARYDALSEQIEATHRQFAARLEAGLATASAETSALKDMVAGLAGKMDAVRDQNSIELAIAALEREMAKVAERLDGADRTFASLSLPEQSIAALFKQFEETPRTALDAAAERSAAPDCSSAAGFHKAGAREGFGQSVASESADLRAAREAADRRVDLTLTALRETVDKVADRLVKVETDLSAMRPARFDSLLAPNLTPVFTPKAARSASDHDKMDDAGAAPVIKADGVRPTSKLSLETKPEFDAKSIETSEILLEPGSGAPPRRERSEPSRVGAPPAISNDLEGEVARRADFIAAARRAAQAAQKDLREPVRGLPAPNAVSNPEPRSGLLHRARRFFGGRKRPLVLSLAALLLTASLYALARTLVHTAAIETLTPALLDQLGNALVNRKAQPPDASNKGAARERPTAAAPAAAPKPVPAAVNSSQLAPPQSLSDPRIEPEQSGPPGAARRALAGSASILTTTFERAGPVRQVSPLRQVAAAPAPENSVPTSKAVGAEEDPRDQAEAGNAMAQFELGQRFAEGRDRPRDYASAARWYEKAAQQGLAKAQYRLATLYERGLGAPRDLARAVTLYFAAAQQGNIRAMHNLGVLAADNPEGRPDYATAALWFAKAAESGVRDSQFNLAVLLARGLGAPQDLVKAYSWFAIVAAQGDAEAAQKRDQIGARLAAADLAAARMAAETFRPQPADQTANEEAPASQGDPAADAGKPKISGL